jgi:hypothetical protein
MLVDAVKEPAVRLLRAGVVFIFHGLTVSLLIGVMWVIEAWLLILWKHEPLIYDRLPLRSHPNHRCRATRVVKPLAEMLLPPHFGSWLATRVGVYALAAVVLAVAFLSVGGIVVGSGPVRSLSSAWLISLAAAVVVLVLLRLRSRVRACNSPIHASNEQALCEREKQYTTEDSA